MKPTKSKKVIHNSFLTNHDLLQGIRNKSFVASRQNSTRMHTNKSNISLIPKKGYDRMHTQQQNISYLSNIDNTSFNPTSGEKAVILLQDCLTELGDSHQKMGHKLRKVLNYIKDMQEEKEKDQKQFKSMEKQREKVFTMKIQQINQQKTFLKKHNSELQLKITELKQKINILKQQRSQRNNNSMQYPSNLQQIIINQSEVINQQCEENQRSNLELRQILITQAKHLEQILKNKQSSQSHQLSSYNYQSNDSYIKTQSKGNNNNCKFQPRKPSSSSIKPSILLLRN